MGGTVNKNDALRIGRGIQNIERLTQKNTTGLNRPVRTKTGIPAKITEVGQFGLYSLIEQQINLDGNGFEDKEPIARIWDDTGDELPEAFEVNGTADLDTDLIVYIFRQSNDESKLNQWLFDSASNTGGTTVATDKSNTSIKGKIQFRNDIPFNANLQGPFDFEFQAPKQVGSLSYGNRAYGGNEDGPDNFAGIQRHYKWMWYKPSVTEGYLMPGTAAFKQSVADEVGLQFLNQMWIRLDHRFDGQVTEIHHGLCAVDFFEQGGGEGRFSETPAGGAQGIIWASATDGGATDIKCEFDKTGHLRRLDDKYGDEDEYPTDVNIKQTSGTYPSSGSLYNTPISQEANLIDENNVDTDAFNGPIGTISYTAIGANGTTLNIGFTVSTGFSLAAKAENIPFGAPIAGTGGNDDDIFWDLSKHLEGSDVTLTSLLLEKNRSSTATIEDVESVQLVTEIKTTPVPDNSSFDVQVDLEHGIGGTQAQGTQFIRFDANGEYQVVVFLFLKADAANFNPDDNQTYLLKESATVADQGTFSGNTVSFTFDFDPNDSGTDVCARAFLEFFKTLVPPQPLPSQIGFCDISNANDFAEDCQPIVGTAATGILTFASSTYSSESIGSSVTIDTFELRNINPIVVVYKIQKGGDTTDYTGLPSRFGLFTPEGIEVRVSEDGITDDFSTVTLINPTDGQATDGFKITINYMEDGLIADGQGYIGRAFVDGVTNTPDEFTFNSTSTLPASDFFGDNSEDLPFPWSDFGGATTLQSTGTSGTEPYDLRFTDVQALGSSARNFTITGLEFLNMVIDGGSLTLWQLESKSGAIDGDFSIKANVTLDNSLLVTTNDSQNIGIQCDIGGSNVFAMLDFEKDGAPEVNFVSEITGTLVKTTASGLGTVNIEIRRTSGTIEIFFDDSGSAQNSKSQTGVMDKFGPRSAVVSGAGRDGNGTVSTFVVKAADHLGTLVDFFSPNMDRWNDNNSAGEAYQIVSLAVNSLEQIIPASAGVDIIRAENLFAGGANPNIATSTWFVESNFTDMLFAGGATETCEIIIENVAVDTMRIGWFGDATGQKFFVNINSSDEVVEDNVTSSGKVTIERGLFTFNDFDGGPQTSIGVGGTQPFDIRWNESFLMDGTGTAVSSLSGSAYVSTVDQVATSVDQSRIDIFSNVQTFLTSQVVEISTDITILNDTNNAGDHSNFGIFGFFVGGDHYHMYIANGNGGTPPPNGIDTGGSWAFITNFRPGGVNNFVNEGPASVGVTYNFKLTYDGSGTIKMFIDGGEVRSGSDSGAVTTIGYETRARGTTGPFSSKFENFKIIVDGEEFTETRVLFNNDDVLKFAFADSGSPVTDIDIVTSTTLTTAFNCTYQEIDIQSPTGTQFTFDPSL